MIGVPVTPELAIALVALAFVAGIGISAIGPGGIFVTIALFLFVPISSATVAGTASLTFVATGLLAATLFRRSGEFAVGYARELAVVLSMTSIVGAFAGSRANLVLSDEHFGYALAAFVVAVGGIILYRELIGLSPTNWLPHLPARWRWAVAATIGLAVGFLGGLLGVGGPVVAVPILVVLGVPMLIALAVAQLQSVFIAGFATVGYWLGDAVSVPLAVLVGVPQLLGVVVGWRIAHAVDERRLRVVLGVVLVVIAPVIAL